MSTAVTNRSSATKNNSFPSRPHRGCRPPSTETTNRSPVCGYGSTYIWYRELSFEVYANHLPSGENCASAASECPRTRRIGSDDSLAPAAQMLQSPSSVLSWYSSVLPSGDQLVSDAPGVKRVAITRSGPPAAGRCTNSHRGSPSSRNDRGYATSCPSGDHSGPRPAGVGNAPLGPAGRLTVHI